MSLWTQKWSKTEDNLIPCPTERTLALLTLDKNGGHQEPHNITGYIAKLEYCIQLRRPKVNLGQTTTLGDSERKGRIGLD